MTVAELIKALRKMPQSLKVVDNQDNVIDEVLLDEIECGTICVNVVALHGKEAECQI